MEGGMKAVAAGREAPREGQAQGGHHVPVILIAEPTGRNPAHPQSTVTSQQREELHGTGRENVGERREGRVWMGGGPVWKKAGF